MLLHVLPLVPADSFYLVLEATLVNVGMKKQVVQVVMRVGQMEILIFINSTF